MNEHQQATEEAVLKVSGFCSFTILSVKMRAGSCSAACDKPRHWWEKQQGPHTLRPISMVQHIKLSFTDKRHSGLLLVTLVLQQGVAGWEMASLCLNHCSTNLLSTLSLSLALNLKCTKDKTPPKLVLNQFQETPQETAVRCWALWLFSSFFLFQETQEM